MDGRLLPLYLLTVCLLAACCPDEVVPSEPTDDFDAARDCARVWAPPTAPEGMFDFGEHEQGSPLNYLVTGLKMDRNFTPSIGLFYVDTSAFSITFRTRISTDSLNLRSLAERLNIGSRVLPETGRCYPIGNRSSVDSVYSGYYVQNIDLPFAEYELTDDFEHSVYFDSIDVERQYLSGRFSARFAGPAHRHPGLPDTVQFSEIDFAVWPR